MIGFFIALLSGALMSLQGVFNTELTKNSSIWAANIWVQFSALILCGICWLVTERSGFSGVFSMQPKYMLSGGVIGAFITYTVIVSMNRLGPTRAVLFIVSAQLIAAYLIEVLGLFGTQKQPVDGRSLLGLIITIIGVAVFKW